MCVAPPDVLEIRVYAGKGRKMFPKMGKTFPEAESQKHLQTEYASSVAVALREELGDTHRAIKTVMGWTGASERTVKNWFAGTSGPSGEHLVAVVRHSDAVFTVFMLLAGREQVAAAKKLIDARDTLIAMLEIVIDLTD